MGYRLRAAMPAAEANKDAKAMRNWEDYADPVFGLTRGAWEREVQQFGTEQSGSAPVVPEYRATIGTSRDASSQWMPPESSPGRSFEARGGNCLGDLLHRRPIAPLSEYGPHRTARSERPSSVNDWQSNQGVKLRTQDLSPTIFNTLTHRDGAATSRRPILHHRRRLEFYDSHYTRCFKREEGNRLWVMCSFDAVSWCLELYTNPKQKLDAHVSKGMLSCAHFSKQIA